MDNSSAHLLEGDGIVTNLFYYIWKQKANADASATAELCVPSTVVLEHNFPKAWYYNAAGDPHELERKLGRDVDTHLILKDFSESAKSSFDEPRGEILATYYSTVDVDGESCTRVEFLDYDGLQEFLLRRTRRPDGVLQKWVSCSGKYNTVVQAVWSPHLCIVTKRQSRVAIRDKRFPLYDRAVTYEGPTHYSNEVFVAPHVKWQVKAICQELVNHLYATQRMAVQRMLLHFKVDHDSNVWLLYCSSMRIADRTQLNLAPRYVRRAGNEEAEERAASNRLAKLLRDEAYEEKGAVKVNVPHLHAKHGAAGSHPLNFMHPKPPTMGPIGDIYNENPQWQKRHKQLQRARQRQQRASSASQTARVRSPVAPPAEDPQRKPPVPKPPAKAKRRRRRARKSEDSARTEADVMFSSLAEQYKTLRAQRSLAHHESLRTEAAGTTGQRRRLRVAHARTLWSVVRLAVLSGTIRLVGQRQEMHEWCQSFLYVVYSHFSCSSAPLVVHVPTSYAAVFPSGWMSRVGLTTRDGTTSLEDSATLSASGSESESVDARDAARSSRSSKIVSGSGVHGGTHSTTVLGCRVPLLQLQLRVSHMLNELLDAPSRKAMWYFAALRYLIFRKFVRDQDQTTAADDDVQEPSAAANTEGVRPAGDARATA